MQIEINGKVCVCEPGETILEVSRRNGFEIPTLCHHPGLPGQGCCRVCLVEQNGRIVPACVTKLEKPCTVRTDSERVIEERGMMLALLRKRAPDSPEIAGMARRWGAPETARLRAAVDGNSCIVCGLCVRACRAIGVGAISTVMRGTQKAVDTPYGAPSEDCIGCAACANVCPTHCIKVEDVDGKRTIWGRQFELVYCESCGELLGTREALAHAGDPDQRLCERCRSRQTGEQVAAALCAGEE